MKIKNGFILRNVANNNIVVSVGNADFNGMIRLNEVATFLWKILEEGASEAELVEKVLDEYDIDKETAAKDVKDFIETLRASNLIDE